MQLRLKDVDDDAWRRAIDALRPVTQSRGVAFLLNDRADLVRADRLRRRACRAGGHAGAAGAPPDGPGRDARRHLQGQPRPRDGRPARTAPTTWRSARSFPPGTKEVTRFIDPEILHWWSELMELPCCAIGGITAENCAPLVQAGADFLAVVGAVWSHPDGPAAGVRALNAAIAAAP